MGYIPAVRRARWPTENSDARACFRDADEDRLYTPETALEGPSATPEPAAEEEDEYEVPEEDGWQFEFEIREGALKKLQKQLLEEAPQPPEGYIAVVRAELGFLSQIVWVKAPKPAPHEGLPEDEAAEVAEEEEEEDEGPPPVPPPHIKLGGKLGRVDDSVRARSLTANPLCFLAKRTLSSLFGPSRWACAVRHRCCCAVRRIAHSLLCLL